MSQGNYERLVAMEAEMKTKEPLLRETILKVEQELEVAHKENEDLRAQLGDRLVQLEDRFIARCFQEEAAKIDAILKRQEWQEKLYQIPKFIRKIFKAE